MVEDFELLEDISDLGRERSHILGQILADAVGIGQETAHRKLTCIVEVYPRSLLEHRIAQGTRELPGRNLENLFLRRLQDHVQAPHDRERKDDVTVFVLFKARTK